MWEKRYGYKPANPNATENTQAKAQPQPSATAAESAPSSTNVVDATIVDPPKNNNPPSKPPMVDLP